MSMCYHALKEIEPRSEDEMEVRTIRISNQKVRLNIIRRLKTKMWRTSLVKWGDPCYFDPVDWSINAHCAIRKYLMEFVTKERLVRGNTPKITSVIQDKDYWPTQSPMRLH